MRERGGYLTSHSLKENLNHLDLNSKVFVKGHLGCVLGLNCKVEKFEWPARNGAHKKWCTQYKATTACTVRLCDKLGMNESNMDIQPRRRVFGDSWFASVDTALALRDQLGVHFTGPIKTATRGFPIQAMRWTLASKNRGDHIVLKSKDYPYLYAIGWHGVHYKCFVTTNGTTLPGPAALKKRQDKHGKN
jgi:hypothetical protein